MTPERLRKLRAAHAGTTPATAVNPTVPARPADTPPSLATGELLAGRYRIIALLGRGGMGDVYEAYDTELDERIGLKTVSTRASADPVVITRIKREIQLARRVTHRNVCRLFDVGFDPDPMSGRETTFLTMELLRGETLAAHLGRTGPMEPVEALPIIEQVAAGLAAAHAAGVVHRDLKAENVFLEPGERGRAVVSDFGIAELAPTEVGHRAAEAGRVMETPAYCTWRRSSSRVETSRRPPTSTRSAW